MSVRVPGNSGGGGTTPVESDVGLIYVGDWASGSSYAAQQSVTHNGGSWASMKVNTDVEPGTDPLTWGVLAAKGADGAGGVAGAASNAQIKIWATSNQLNQNGTPTYASGGGIQSVAILWPDGTAGVYTAVTFDTTYTSLANAWHATYVGTASTVTATQPLMTRNADGTIATQPAITVA